MRFYHLCANKKMSFRVWCLYLQFYIYLPLKLEERCITVIRQYLIIYLLQVGALQDVRSELTKLRGVLFYKVLEDLHAHLYNKGEYRSLFCFSPG